MYLVALWDKSPASSNSGECPEHESGDEVIVWDSEVVFDEHTRSVLIGIEVSRASDTELIGPKVIFKTNVKACVGPVKQLAEVVLELRIDLQVFCVAFLVGRKHPVDEAIQYHLRSANWPGNRKAGRYLPAL